MEDPILSWAHKRSRVGSETLIWSWDHRSGALSVREASKNQTTSKERQQGHSFVLASAINKDTFLPKSASTHWGVRWGRGSKLVHWVVQKTPSQWMTLNWYWVGRLPRTRPGHPLLFWVLLGPRSTASCSRSPTAKTQRQTIHDESRSAQTTPAKLDQKTSDIRMIRTRIKISELEIFKERRIETMDKEKTKTMEVIRKRWGGAKSNF